MIDLQKVINACPRDLLVPVDTSLLSSENLKFGELIEFMPSVNFNKLTLTVNRTTVSAAVPLSSTSVKYCVLGRARFSRYSSTVFDYSSSYNDLICVTPEHFTLIKKLTKTRKQDCFKRTGLSSFVLKNITKFNEAGIELYYTNNGKVKKDTTKAIKVYV